MTSLPSSCYSPLSVFAELTALYTQPDSTLCSTLLNAPISELSPVTPSEYLTTLGLTLSLELVFFLIPFIVHQESAKNTLKKGFQSALLCNLISHPIVYFAFPSLALSYEMTYLGMLIRAELFAPLIETLVFLRFWKLNPMISLICIVVANLTSWGIGIFLI